MERLLFVGAMNLCEENGILKAFQIVGFALIIIKIVVPILLIGLGTFELGKAAINNDDKAIKLAVTALVKKFIAGVVIFFLPTLISFIMSLVDGVNDLNKFDACTKCLNEPSTCDLKSEGGLFE